MFDRLIFLKNKYKLIDFIKNSKYGTTYYKDFKNLIILQSNLQFFYEHYYDIEKYENKKEFIDLVEKNDDRPLKVQLEELKSTVEAIESNVDVLIDKVDILEGDENIEETTEE